MRLLFLGDIVGRTGREAVLSRLPALREKLALDLVVVNAENASHGFGLSPLLPHPCCKAAWMYSPLATMRGIDAI